VHNAEVGGLKAGNKYQLRVRAYNDRGPSDWSEVLEAPNLNPSASPDPTLALNLTLTLTPTLTPTLTLTLTLTLTPSPTLTLTRSSR